MAVNELDRDFLRLTHQADTIDDLINNRKMIDAPENERKSHAGNIVHYLEEELLDTKWVDAGKDVSGIEAAIARGRAFYQG